LSCLPSSPVTSPTSKYVFLTRFYIFPLRTDCTCLVLHRSRSVLGLVCLHASSEQVVVGEGVLLSPSPRQRQIFFARYLSAHTPLSLFPPFFCFSSLLNAFSASRPLLCLHSFFGLRDTGPSRDNEVSLRHPPISPIDVQKPCFCGLSEPSWGASYRSTRSFTFPRLGYPKV